MNRSCEHCKRDLPREADSVHFCSEECFEANARAAGMWGPNIRNTYYAGCVRLERTRMTKLTRDDVERIAHELGDPAWNDSVVHLALMTSVDRWTEREFWLELTKALTAAKAELFERCMRQYLTQQVAYILPSGESE